VISKTNLDSSRAFCHIGRSSKEEYFIIQGFKDSKIQRFKDSKIQGFKDSKIQRFKDSKIQGFKDSRIQRFKNSIRRRITYKGVSPNLWILNFEFSPIQSGGDFLSNGQVPIFEFLNFEFSPIQSGGDFLSNGQVPIFEFWIFELYIFFAFHSGVFEVFYEIGNFGGKFSCFLSEFV